MMRARLHHLGSRRSGALAQQQQGGSLSLLLLHNNPPLPPQAANLPFRKTFQQGGRRSFAVRNYSNSTSNSIRYYGRTTNDNDKRRAPYRPWLDNRLSPEQRVNKFVEVEIGELGWQAVAYDSIPLADRCCRFNDFVGMKLAHDVLDRCLAEKLHHDDMVYNNQQQRQQQRLDQNQKPLQKEGGQGLGPFFVPYMLFQKILYGWACMATKGEVARRNMRELMDLLKQVSIEEKRMFQNYFDASDGNDGKNNNNSNTFRLQPTTYTYNTYLTGIRNACYVSGEAAQTAREILNEMIYVNREYGWHTKPNTKSYTLVLHSFRNSGYKDCGREAEKVLRRMQRAHQEERDKYLEEYGVEYDTNEPNTNKRRIVTPDAIAYGHVIQAYAKDPSERSASKARDLLIEIMNVKDGTVQPDLALLTATITAFASLAENVRISKALRSNAAQQAEEILETWLGDMMESDFHNGNNNSTNTNNNKEITNQEGFHLVAPYNACINAWAKCDAPDASLKAEAMLQRLLSDFIEGRSSIHPDKISFNTVLNGWARSKIPDAARKAEDLMKLQMQLIESGDLPECVKPDVQSFSTVMLAYARSNDHDKVTETYRLLHELIEGLAENKVAPDDRNLVVAFTAVLDAAAFPPKERAPKGKPSDAIKRASDSRTDAPANEPSAIDEGSDEATSDDPLVSDETHTTCSPESTEAITSVPDACENATIANGSEISEEVTNASSMRGSESTIDDPWTPDETPAVTMNINEASQSASFDAVPDTSTGSDDYNIALQVYRELKDDVFRVGCRPDHIAFAKMILVVGAHTEETSTERTQMIQLIFEDACQAGEVSKLVVKSILKAKADNTFLASLFQNDDFLERYVQIESVDEFPRMWTRNVPQKFRYMRRVNSRNNHRRYKKI